MRQLHVLVEWPQGVEITISVGVPRRNELDSSPHLRMNSDVAQGTYCLGLVVVFRKPSSLELRSILGYLFVTTCDKETHTRNSGPRRSPGLPGVRGILSYRTFIPHFAEFGMGVRSTDPLHEPMSVYYV